MQGLSLALIPLDRNEADGAAPANLNDGQDNVDHDGQDNVDRNEADGATPANLNDGQDNGDRDGQDNVDCNEADGATPANLNDGQDNLESGVLKKSISEVPRESSTTALCSEYVILEMK